MTKSPASSLRYPNLLISNDEDYDPICGIPRMSAVPISITAVPAYPQVSEIVM